MLARVLPSVCSVQSLERLATVEAPVVNVLIFKLLKLLLTTVDQTVEHQLIEKNESMNL